MNNSQDFKSPENFIIDNSFASTSHKHPIDLESDFRVNFEKYLLKQKDLKLLSHSTKEYFANDLKNRISYSENHYCTKEARGYWFYYDVYAIYKYRRHYDHYVCLNVNVSKNNTMVIGNVKNLKFFRDYLKQLEKGIQLDKQTNELETLEHSEYQERVSLFCLFSNAWGTNIGLPHNSFGNEWWWGFIKRFPAEQKYQYAPYNSLAIKLHIGPNWSPIPMEFRFLTSIYINSFTKPI